MERHLLVKEILFYLSSPGTPGKIYAEFCLTCIYMRLSASRLKEGEGRKGEGRPKLVKFRHKMDRYMEVGASG